MAPPGRATARERAGDAGNPDAPAPEKLAGSLWRWLRARIAGESPGREGDGMVLPDGARVLLYSADNPDAAYLAAGLLRGHAPGLGGIALRNVATGEATRLVRDALAALGHPLGG